MRFAPRKPKMLFTPEKAWLADVRSSLSGASRDGADCSTREAEGFVKISQPSGHIGR